MTSVFLSAGNDESDDQGQGTGKVRVYHRDKEDDGLLILWMAFTCNVRLSTYSNYILHICVFVSNSISIKFTSLLKFLQSY